MKKNEKGFTLIELLAVIVILAIIALIATPIVMNVINKSRQKAAEDSAYGVIEAVKSYHAEKMLDISADVADSIKITWTNSAADKTDFKLSGTKPKSGSVEIKADGTVEVTDLIINGYKCNGTDTVTCANNA